MTKAMTALLLNGANDSSLDEIQKAITHELEMRNIDVTSRIMREIDIKFCTGCFGCWVKTPGKCVIDDESRNITKQMVRADVLVYLTPISFGGYSYQLKKAVDRFIPNILPYFKCYNGETHHKQRYENRSRLVAYGVLDREDKEQERMFALLNYRNFLNMKPPGNALGIIYKTDSINEIIEKITNALNSAEVNNA